MKTDKKGPVSSSKHNEKYTSSISVYQYIICEIGGSMGKNGGKIWLDGEECVLLQRQ